MLNEYKPGDLPGGDIKGASEDITSYEKIEEVAKATVENCVMELKSYGWIQTGMTCSRAFNTSWLSIEHYSEFAAFEFRIQFHYSIVQKAGSDTDANQQH